MNWMLVLGAVASLAGPVLLYMSAKRDNDSSAQEILQETRQAKAEIIAQIGTFKGELNQAQQAATGSNVGNVNEVTNDFDKWAKDLDANYPRLSLEVQQQEAQRQADQLAEVKVPLEFFGAAVDDLRGIVAAINARNKGGQQIDANLPTLEVRNLALDTPWGGYINFDKYTQWQLHIQVTRSKPPMFCLFLSDNSTLPPNSKEPQIIRGNLQLQLQNGLWSTTHSTVSGYFATFPNVTMSKVPASDLEKLRATLEGWIAGQIVRMRNEQLNKPENRLGP